MTLHREIHFEDEICADLAAAGAPLEAELSGADPALTGIWHHLAAAILDRLAGEAARPVAQRLMEIELAIALMTGWTRLAALDRALGASA